MSQIKTTDMTEERFKTRYRKASKILLILMILYIIWVIVVIIGTYFFEGMGYNWALLQMDHWILSAIILAVFFVVLEILFLLHVHSGKKRRLELEKPKPLFYKGKRLHEFTYPKHARGGMFSKTYISVDEHTIIRLRMLMIPPEDLWSKEESGEP